MYFCDVYCFTVCAFASVKRGEALLVIPRFINTHIIIIIIAKL